MFLNFYRKVIRTEHWEEFVGLVFEKVEIKEVEIFSVEKRMSFQEELEIAAGKIAVKYHYDDGSDMKFNF